MGAIPEVDPDEPVETKPFKFVTAGYDARFPQQNQYVIFAHLSAQSASQTKHCWQNYVDYHKCVTAKGEDFRPCRQFYHAFRSLCPKAWTDRWDGQREAGNFPARLDR
ncbi:cytochrome c oxidase subunit 6B [Aspergillus eucalypticola CBS 122712]|uniref:Cytochrome c oxidase subunit 6B n=1 Tax=Aspergillus eucalypticola (strain CBS 122712 / IBT 29274) TaxID=1448314 RepID=A0A317VGH8_ASPEC|nr:cytochrome c oxidase subunit 6B [Aspergillus eucalypticola CBS 122712]PWY72108.1 cytochrome c oxidase subunit 6B [Aspergillus eucalypticola CBS 122712]